MSEIYKEKKHPSSNHMKATNTVFIHEVHLILSSSIFIFLFWNKQITSVRSGSFFCSPALLFLFTQRVPKRTLNVTQKECINKTRKLNNNWGRNLGVPPVVIFCVFFEIRQGIVTLFFFFQKNLWRYHIIY